MIFFRLDGLFAFVTAILFSVGQIFNYLVDHNHPMVFNTLVPRQISSHVIMRALIAKSNLAVKAYDVFFFLFDLNLAIIALKVSI
jgi:hypothetical protein